MKGRGDDRLWTMRELGFAAALLTVYGLVIFFSPDPEWVVWAGSMMVGALDVSSFPSLTASVAHGTLRTAAGVSALGLLVAAFLLAGTGSGGLRWFAETPGAICERSHSGGSR